MGLAQQSVCSSRGNGPLVNVAVLLATFLSGIQRERMKLVISMKVSLLIFHRNILF